MFLPRIFFVLVLSLSFLNFSHAGKPSRKDRLDCQFLLETTRLLPSQEFIKQLKSTRAKRDVTVEMVLSKNYMEGEVNSPALFPVEYVPFLSRLKMNNVKIVRSLILGDMAHLQISGKASSIIKVLEGMDAQEKAMEPIRQRGERPLIGINGLSGVLSSEQIADTTNLQQVRLVMQKYRFSDDPQFAGAEIRLFNGRYRIVVYVTAGKAFPNTRHEYVDGVGVSYLYGVPDISADLARYVGKDRDTFTSQKFLDLLNEAQKEGYLDLTLFFKPHVFYFDPTTPNISFYERAAKHGIQIVQSTVDLVHGATVQIRGPAINIVAMLREMDAISTTGPAKAHHSTFAASLWKHDNGHALILTDVVATDSEGMIDSTNRDAVRWLKDKMVDLLVKKGMPRENIVTVAVNNAGDNRYLVRVTLVNGPSLPSARDEYIMGVKINYVYGDRAVGAGAISAD